MLGMGAIFGAIAAVLLISAKFLRSQKIRGDGSASA
jgi:hypothetical protein